MRLFVEGVAALAILLFFVIQARADTRAYPDYLLRYPCADMTRCPVPPGHNRMVDEIDRLNAREFRGTEKNAEQRSLPPRNELRRVH